MNAVDGRCLYYSDWVLLTLLLLQLLPLPPQR